MPLFRRGLSTEDKGEALRLVHHVQTLFAFQQLTMERYNDAVANITGVSLGSELSHRYLAGQGTTLGVSQSILPAVVHKLGIIAEMERRHQDFDRPTLAALTRAYDSCSRMLAAMRNRAEAQQAGWEKWVADATMDAVDTTLLDRAEAKAAEVSINSINNVIFKDLKLKPEEFIEINRQATNYVRATLGLDPLTLDEYGFLYISGIQGLPTRLFSA